MADRYRKKPVEVEAVIWDGTNDLEMLDFMGELTIEIDTAKLRIETLEGAMMADTGDYIIKGVNGEFYPCKPDIFEKTYEKVK